MSKPAIANDAPIGIFDSGVGGLTVARAIRDQLPSESITYVGDTAHTPYGPRPIAEVRRLSLAILDDLVDQGVKALVIACNTASAAVLRDAHERYDIPVLEVIKPAVRSAVSLTRNGRVGLIGTVGTINSRVYDDLFSIRPEITLSTQACPRFVELVEAGITAGPEVHRIAAEYLQPLIDQQIDTLVLGCTHYPFLRGAIRQVVGPDVALVSSDIETANELYTLLSERDMLREAGNEPVLRYEATGNDPGAFRELARRMLGIGIDAVDHLQTGVVPVQRNGE
ncbi:MULTISPECIES: glutamate racemase [unclassified Leucobacter]|uniref:glutamate racemase n=1 Tax=unclassified Leucobacter TaxID=2621730 RepID=UPI00165D7384|nr:glutamate racemase [Leucobacter sp. CX169]MBC9926350.1 glutamate racemase [Leucobacter sp. cx-169]MBC9936900.1 glutamate racemase [Leucobacter sp. cx-87]